MSNVRPFYELTAESLEQCNFRGKIHLLIQSNYKLTRLSLLKVKKKKTHQEAMATVVLQSLAKDRKHTI